MDLDDLYIYIYSPKKNPVGFSQVVISSHIGLRNHALQIGGRELRPGASRMLLVQKVQKKKEEIGEHVVGGNWTQLWAIFL